MVRSAGKTVSWAVLLALVLAATAAAQSPSPASTPRAVVLLYSFQHGLSGHDLGKGNAQVMAEVLAALRTTDDDVRLHVEELELSPLSDRDYFQQAAEELRQGYADVQIAAVVAINFRALEFLILHGDSVFPGSAIIFGGVEKRRLRGLELGPNVTGVMQDATIVETIDVALQVLPDSERIFLVMGTSDTDRFVESVAREELLPYAGTIDVIYPTDRTVSGLLEQVSELPENSIVLFLTVIQAGSDDVVVPTNFVTLISARSSAPTFSILDAFLGRGIVGGDLAALEMKSLMVGQQLGRILNGQAPADIPVVELKASQVMFDARQLKRWHIARDRLPNGSVVRYEESTLWDEYRWIISGAAAFSIAQLFLIGALLVNRRKRRQATNELAERLMFEQLAASLSSRFVNLPATEINQQVEAGLLLIVETLSVDRCSLFQFSDDMRTLPLLKSAARPDVDPIPQMDAVSELPWVAARVHRGEIVQLESLDELPDAAAGDRAALERLRTQSSLFVPVAVRDGPFCVMSVSTAGAKRNWSDEATTQLQSLGTIFANAVTRARMDHELHRSHDEVTKLRDRLQAETAYLQEEVRLTHGHDAIVGDSEVIKGVLQQVARRDGCWQGPGREGPP